MPNNKADAPNEAMALRLRIQDHWFCDVMKNGSTFLLSSWSYLVSRSILLFIVFLTWVSHSVAFEIKLYPASQVYAEDTEFMHERLGVKSNPLKLEGFEDAVLEPWLRSNLKSGDKGIEQSVWSGDRTSTLSDSADIKILIPNVRAFGVGLSDNDGGNERISINGNPHVPLKTIQGHAGNGGGRAYYVRVTAEPEDPDIKSVVFDRCFTVYFDHLFVLQANISPRVDEPVPRMVISLVDGTRLVAYSAQGFMPVTVHGKPLDLSFAQVYSMQVLPQSTTASVILWNGDKFVCELRSSELPVTTIIGEVTLQLQMIRRLKVSPRGEFKPRQEGRVDKVKSQFHAAEPKYDGKYLRWWISSGEPQPQSGNVYDLLLSPSANVESLEQKLSTQAIQRMGSKAVPFLLEMLRRDYQNARKAVGGFAALGQLGKNAVPELLILLDEPYDTISYYNTISSIGHIGPAAESAIPFLLAELRLNAQPHVAADALGNIGPLAVEAVPLILEILSAGDYPYDIPFITALGKIGSKDVVPMLTDIALGTDSRRIPENGLISELRRHRAVEALGNLGPVAEAAVPSLLGLLKRDGPGNYLSQKIEAALPKIQTGHRD